ncbi:hypothetical protein JEQ12_011774 [Ovis aries]|uniref:Uncharacterized protein n=1 Tax=Ovis aries TaxID=9940 RepID=A0A835ZMA4_SHEEP|nr:hypothetical protein JEQ12_011774 [Ovis aries]
MWKQMPDGLTVVIFNPGLEPGSGEQSLGVHPGTAAFMTPHKLEVETRPADTLADGPHGSPGQHRTGQAWLPQQWRPPTGPGRAARVLGQHLMFSGLDENQLVLSKPGPGPGFRKGRASQRLKLGSGTA